MTSLEREAADHLLTTTRSVRRRLDLKRPVPLALVRECLEVALQAPTGSNTQKWEFVVVTDPTTRSRLADVYKRAFTAYAAGESNLGRFGFDPAEAHPPEDPRAQRVAQVYSSAGYLAEHMHEVPVLVLFCIRGRPEGGDAVALASLYGSVVPSAWSFMLAARARGLGSAWTTIHLIHEQEAAAAVGLPPDVTQAVLIPLAFAIGDEFRPAARRKLDDVLHWNRFGNRAQPADPA